jgi:hypothetical protein
MKPGDIPSIPYFPAPKDAPDSCSCNFGTVYGAVRAINRQASSCLNNIKLAPSIAVSGSKNFQDENGKFDKESFSQFLCECDETEAALSRYITRSTLPQCYKRQGRTKLYQLFYSLRWCRPFLEPRPRSISTGITKVFKPTILFKVSHEIRRCQRSQLFCRYI